MTFVQNNDTKEILQATKTCMITTGMVEMSSFDNKLKLYPNPTSGKFIIESEGIESLEILDITGKSIRGYQYPGIDILNIDISDLPKGAYFVIVKNEKGTATMKLVKK